MTSPQVENGYTKIANEIVDQFQRLHLSGNEWKVLWVVVRKTYGWKKKEDRISLTQFQNLTSLSRPSVSEAINKLVGKKVLAVNKEGSINVYAFNKLYTEWASSENPTRDKIVGKTLLPSREKGTSLVGKKEPKLVGKKEHTKEKKETITKETITKERSKDVALLIDLFSKVNPSHDRLFKNKTERASCNRLIEKYGFDRMFNLMRQLPSIINKPYAPTITTPYQLESKMGSLIAYMQKERIRVNKFSVAKI